MGTIAKFPRSELSLPIITIVVFTFAVIVLFYTERISFLSSSTIFKFKPCAEKGLLNSTNSINDHKNVTEDNVVHHEADDRIDFDPNECSVDHGMWVFNSSFKPLYTDKSCPYVNMQASCMMNGRPDSGYRHWEWQLDDCILPRFDPKMALERIRGQRLMFVGDSVQKGQWESFVCLVESVIPEDQKSMRRARPHSVFKAKEYNATIEFYWAPYLVESNSDIDMKYDPKQRILRVDSIAKHAKHWIGVDVLVFNTYVWWMSTPKIKSLWGSFATEEEGYEELDVYVSYRLGLKTWANWVDSTVDPNKTRVFFTTISPAHFRSVDWNHKGGIGCYNETRPIMKRGHWGSGSDKEIMSVVADVVGKMKFPITFINITQLSEYRVDAHASVYTAIADKGLTDEQKADPKTFSDCIHWCLPGVPDTWNQILLAYLQF